MPIDFSQEIKITERKISKFLEKGIPVPKDLLSYYNNLSDINSAGAPAGLTEAQTTAAMKAALESQSQTELTDTLLRDANGVTFIRRARLDEETGALIYTNLDLNGATFAAVSPFKAAAADDNVVSSTIYYARAAGPGYSIGDVIQKNINNQGTIIWHNDTTSAIISSPLPVDITTNTRDVVLAYTNYVVTPHTVDLPFLSSAGKTFSPIISVPILCGKKANFARIIKVSNTPAASLNIGNRVVFGFQGRNSSLVPNIAPLYIMNANNSLSLGYAPNVPGSVSHLIIDHDTTSIAPYNHNTSLNTINIEFYYEDISTSYNNLKQINSSVQQSNIPAATTGQVLNLSTNIKDLLIFISATGATGLNTFVLECESNVSGLLTYIPIATLSLPASQATNGVYYKLDSLNLPITNIRLICTTPGLATTYSYIINNVGEI